jgi:hypothetical protein
MERWQCITTLIMVGMFTFHGAHGDEQPGIELLRSRWRERAELVHTLSLQAVDTNVISKGAVELRRQTASEMKFAIDPLARYTVLDDGSAVSRNPIRIVIAGTRSRVECGDERQAESYRYITVTDGQSLITFNPVGGESEGTVYPTGYVYDASSERARPDPHQWPPLWYLIGPEECCARITGRPCEARLVGAADVDGDPCLRVSVDTQRPNETIEFLISCTKGYHVLGMTHMTKGRASMHMDCHYALNADRHWILNSWTLTYLRGNGVADSVMQVDVDRFEMNPAVDETSFAIVFPPGTVVSDYRETAKKGRTGSYDYVVRADGSQRRITWSERATTYDALMVTDSDVRAAPANAASLPVKRQWLWGLVALCILSCVALCNYIFLRRCAIGSRMPPQQLPGRRETDL